MTGSSNKPTRSRVIVEDPLEGESLLVDALFGSANSRVRAHNDRPVRDVPKPVQSKPQHYKIVSISLYTEDIEKLDEMVRELKRRGNYKANKSQLIRHALNLVNLDEVPGSL